jgi:splicing factor 3B subunit 3
VAGDGSKFIQYYEMINFQLLKNEPVRPDVLGIFAVVGHSGASSLVTHSADTLFLEAQVQLPINAQIHSCTDLGDGSVLLQLIDESMWCLDVENVALVSRGRLPLCSIIRPLPNRLFLCVPDHGTAFLLEAADSFRATNFQSTAPIELEFTPIITHAILHGPRLFVASVAADKYLVKQYENTLRFSQELLEEPTELFGLTSSRDIEEGSVRLVAAPGDLLISSTDSRSTLLSGRYEIFTGPTIAIGQLGDGAVQVHRSGIRGIGDSREWRSPSPIVTAAIFTTESDTYCIVALENHHCVLFDSDLVLLVEREVGSVTAFASCGETLAVAIASSAGPGASVTLYQSDLVPTDAEAQLTSHITSMVYLPSTMELFAANRNGNVLKWVIDRFDFALNCATVYTHPHSKPVSVIPFHDSVLIHADRTILINGERLLLLGLDQPLSIISAGDNRFYYVSKTAAVYSGVVHEFDRDLTFTTFCPSSTLRRLFALDDRTCALCRQATADSFQSTFDILTPPSTIRFEDSLGLISALKFPGPPSFLVLGFLRRDDTGVLDIRSVDDLTRPAQVLAIPAPPYAMVHVNGSVLVAVGKRLRHLSFDGARFSLAAEPLASLHSQIAFIEATDAFVWIADRTQSVICFDLPANDERKRLLGSPVAVDTQPRQLTAMAVLDEVTVALGDRFGGIVLLRLPDDIVARAPWRTSLPPERGVYMPSTGHLVRVAAFATGEAVVALMRRGGTMLYATLLGRVGGIVPVVADDEWFWLTAAEAAAERARDGEIGLFSPRRFSHGCISVVDADLIEAVDALGPEFTRAIEEEVKIPRMQLMSLIARLKTGLKLQ